MEGTDEYINNCLCPVQDRLLWDHVGGHLIQGSGKVSHRGIRSFNYLFSNIFSRSPVIFPVTPVKGPGEERICSWSQSRDSLDVCMSATGIHLKRA